MWQTKQHRFSTTIYNRNCNAIISSAHTHKSLYSCVWLLTSTYSVSKQATLNCISFVLSSSQQLKQPKQLSRLLSHPTLANSNIPFTVWSTVNAQFQCLQFSGSWAHGDKMTTCWCLMNCLPVQYIRESTLS